MSKRAIEMVCCESHRRDEHNCHAPHGHVYCPTVQQEAGSQWQRRTIHIGYEGREVIGQGDESPSAHATDYECEEGLFNDIVGKQQCTAGAPEYP